MSQTELSAGYDIEIQRQLQMASQIIVNQVCAPSDLNASLALVESILRSNEFPVDHPILPNGMTTLMVAVRQGHLAFTKLILAIGGTNLLATDTAGMTVLHHAVLA